MTQLRRFLSVCFLSLGLWQGAAAQSVLVIGTSPVPQGKFAALAAASAPYGVKIEGVLVERLSPQRIATLFQGYDLVVFDTPRDHLEARVKGILASALPGLKAPQLWMHERNLQAQGVPKPVAERLHGYFVNGGRGNFDGFARTLATHWAGKPQATVLSAAPDPFVFPDAAIYHPKAPRQVFATPAEYFRWREVDLKQRPPVVAIAFHQSAIGAEQTALIDDLIARIEQGGAIALPYYAPVMGKHESMLTVGGQRAADIVINAQIVLDPEGRRKELAKLGIPVLQALSYRKGDEAAWRTDPQGVPLMDVPFYLAQGEYAGMTDAVVVGAMMASGDIAPISAQAAALVNKALNQVRLQRLPNADKKIAFFYWNYPPGEKNLSASYLNVTRSLEVTLKAMKAQGYDVLPEDEIVIINKLQRLLTPFYREGQFKSLLADGLAERLPLKTYQAWFKTLPAEVQREVTERWGGPEKASTLLHDRGEAYFVIPRMVTGKSIITPQAPRGGQDEGNKEKALYHSTKAAPSHFYLAQYLWVRETFQANAIVHYGTHGSQEWLPGKERGLAMSDYPNLMVGDVPVIYPYIVDNIGEALQTKRRGRATVVSHQTPPFAPAGLHEALTRIHDLLHAWMAQDDGSVKQKLAADLLRDVKKERIDKDLGWDDARIAKDLPGFVNELHDHLHELAQTAQPLGLHTLGTPPLEKYRLGTVLLMLGKPYWEAAARAAGIKEDDLDEVFVGDYTRLTDSLPYRLLKDAIAGKPAPADPKLAEMLAQGKRWYADVGAAAEMEGLLSALNGEYRPTSYGGDPIKNPDALPTGRNMYGFDPSRVPTKQAWEAGKEAAEALLATHRAKSGKTPKKLAFTLWSVETMRHQGMLEAQALWAMGVEPVWDAGGRVIDVKLVPRDKLKRPRVDVVLSATGLYRDHFPNTMKQLAKAVELAARAEEADNPVYANSRDIAARLQKQGVPEKAAKAAAETRIFSSESGRYGTGLDDAALATDTWKSKAEGDRKLAQLYLSKMQFAYGTDESTWGSKGIAGGGGKAGNVNLYAEHLKGTEAAVLSRTSNLYGMLTTDDPFQYLGGIGAAVRHLDGKAPELYISNLRGSGSGKVEGADKFLAKELATRNFHPGYIQGLMDEGYSGTLQVLDSMNNFSGWTAVAREIVRDDQWQEFVDVYVRDKHKLGLKPWFERNNPHALAQTIERMLEAARHGYWQADAKTVRELKERYRDLAKRYDVQSENKPFTQFVNAGFGLQGSAPAVPGPTRPQTAADLVAPTPPPVQGMVLERVEQAASVPPPDPMALLGGMLLMLATVGGGLSGWRQRRGAA